ncbi:MULTISPECIES: hypothetical protein [Flavobacterium]|uniref:Uncharacterized protein n=1 Tax=Flavobacterium covae TaxID=2906076 RepID=A0ABW8PHU5_9FLAO|nr:MULTISPECIES: hypothetical protein [Flavobacterium]OXA83983.1 hypothetical protein B0A56_00115 [Flavobacterium columnare NBRC 100251 = ATCC 23463]AMA48442.1 hypothetical protein AWN65_02685 [Flavobacterium covae]AND65428.1 hypothetical protein AX766_14080 [Flavobacterium covae]MCJ1806885.1 hypothetical protein [Flavobacterium covae]MCJ1809198.1 hypothetical protein [Flavobacterium covae]
MKKLSFIIGVFLVILNFQISAQVSVNLNIAEHPNWCTNYSENQIQYVYLPELECYYDNFNQTYIYLGPRGWCRSSTIPDYCREYDIQRAPRVIIDYRGNCPWTSFNYHKKHHWKNNYRNYHSEYYGPAYSRRGNYVTYRNRDYDHDYYYRRNDDHYEDRRENNNSYRDQKEYRTEEREPNHAHGRRF